MLIGDFAGRGRCFPMKKTNKKICPSVAVDASSFITAQQASAMLNLPLYYFINHAKRDQMGVPHYFINRMVRYRLGELHRWQVSLAHRMVEVESAVARSVTALEGSVDA